ncbi:hypothetical protein QOZ80_5BG0445490 [Eleusine coracana subsp. coracana]|nr:hypothetical protein QOZ80_5BG0445490 [Eleusine coracana subsp. coracana]
MRPSAVLLLLIVAASGSAAAHGRPAAVSLAARFWEQAMPGTLMPEAIADLVKKGNDHAPGTEHYPALPGISVCGAWTGMCTASLAAATGIFFHKAQLRVGSTMTLSFPAEPEPPILPHAVAENLPFANLTAVLSTFNIPPGSTEARHVAATLRLCRSPPHPGALKACAASLETTVRVAVDMLGAADHGAWWAATSEIPASGGLPRQLYGVQGGQVEPAHPAFEVLRVRPGTPVCHFMPYANPVFGKKKATKP